jgi:hypothetical protein
MHESLPKPFYLDFAALGSYLMSKGCPLYPNNRVATVLVFLLPLTYKASAALRMGSRSQRIQPSAVSSAPDDEIENFNPNNRVATVLVFLLPFPQNGLGRLSCMRLMLKFSAAKSRYFPQTPTRLFTTAMLEARCLSCKSSGFNPDVQGLSTLSQQQGSHCPRLSIAFPPKRLGQAFVYKASAALRMGSRSQRIQPSAVSSAPDDEIENFSIKPRGTRKTAKVPYFYTSVS